MTKEQAQLRAEALHAEEIAEKDAAGKLPAGDQQDEHRMRGERLSDEAWSLEEAHDLEPTASGLWPDPIPA